MSARKAAHRRDPRAASRRPGIAFWRFALVVIAICWFFAALEWGLSEWLVPALYAGQAVTPLNPAPVIVTSLIVPLGRYVALFLVALGPLLVAWMGLQRGGDRLIRAALGVRGRDR